MPEQLAVFYVVWRPLLLGLAALACTALAAWERPCRPLRIFFIVSGTVVFLWAALPYLPF